MHNVRIGKDVAQELVSDPWRRGLAVIALVLAAIPLLSSSAVPLQSQPFPDAPTYAYSAYEIANGNGFRTRIDETLPPDQQVDENQLQPSRYPPGFPLFLAPFVRYGDNEAEDAQKGARAAAVLLLLSAFLAAWTLGGPLAAGFAALLIWWSPFARQSSELVMSDAFAASLTLLVLALLGLAWSSHRRERVRAVLMTMAGVAAGYGVLVRISALATLVSALLTAKRRYVRVVIMGALPFLLFLGSYQWTEFGSPLRTGYDYYLPTLVEFSPDFVTREYMIGERAYVFEDKLDGRLMTWTCPCDDVGPIGKAGNLVFYPAVLLGLYWIFYPPLVSILGIWEMIRRRKTPAAKFASSAAAMNLVIFLPYFYQGARFVAPAAFVLLTFAAASLGRVTNRVFVSVRGLRKLVDAQEFSTDDFATLDAIPVVSATSEDGQSMRD